MAQLKFNNQMWACLNTQNGSFTSGTSNIDVGQIYIFQGAKPSQAEAFRYTVNNLVSTTGLNPRGADILLRSSTTNYKFVVSNNTLYLGEMTAVAATGTGAATWAAVVMGTNTANNGQVFIGDVSDTASDAFLQINNVNITVGEKYKILGMQITFDHEYTF